MMLPFFETFWSVEPMEKFTNLFLFLSLSLPLSLSVFKRIRNVKKHAFYGICHPNEIVPPDNEPTQMNRFVCF